MKSTNFQLCRQGLALLILSTCILFLLAIDSAAAAEFTDLPQMVTIAQLLEIVREKSPRFAALRVPIEAAKADVVGAGILPNPRVTYGRYDLVSRRNTMYDGNVQQEVTLEIPVLIAGQRSARRTAAERRLEATEAGVEADFAGLAYEVWRLFVKLLAGQDRVAVLRDAANDIERLRAIVAGREEAGSASPYDVLRIGIEGKSLDARLESARNELVATAGDMGSLLGLPGWQPEAVGKLAPLGVPTDLASLWDEAERRNPELEAARRQQLAADAGLDRARRERWPTPSLLVGSAFTERPYGMAFFAGVSVELPLFDRGQGGMARASVEKQAASLEQQLIVSRTRAELERALELLARRRDSRMKFEREVVNKLPSLKQMGESAYRLGKGTLLELLDASRSRTQIRIDHLDLLEAETVAELDALKASGLLVSTVEQELR
jgi:cobalt-zinc-cadmium efflux system outer membrane protein